MKSLRAFEFASTGNRATYDWAKLLDGSIYQLEAGKDFSCKPETFLLLAKKHAKKAGKTLKASKVDGGLVIQAVGKAADAAAANKGTESPKSGKGGGKKAEGPEAGTEAVG
jgi:hypothetical protein